MKKILFFDGFRLMNPETRTEERIPADLPRTILPLGRIEINGAEYAYHDTGGNIRIIYIASKFPIGEFNYRLMDELHESIKEMEGCH